MRHEGPRRGLDSKEGDEYIDLWSDMISLSGPLDQFHEVQTTIQRFLCAAQKNRSSRSPNFFRYRIA